MTSTPYPPCGTGADYAIVPSSGASIVPGLTDTGSHCDDCLTAITLPFAARLYGTSFTTTYASSNGNLQFVSKSDDWFSICLPIADYPDFNHAIFAYWDDLRTNGTGTGIFTSVSGSAPNRVFNIEWRACIYSDASCDVTTNFEIRLYEGQDNFEIIYGAMADNGANATVGVQRASGSSASQYACDSPILQPGLKLTFSPYVCGQPTPTPTSTRTPVSDTSLVGHVIWQGHTFGLGQALPITLTLRLRSGGPANEYTGLTTDASGFFTVSVTGLPAGLYNWRTKGPFAGPNTNPVGSPGYLAVTGTLTLPGSGVTQAEMGPQLPGDVDGNNVVNLLDFSALQLSYGRLETDPGYDARCDYSGNDIIGITDFNMFQVNFGKLGAGPVRPER